MIKCSNNVLLIEITKLFKLILDSHYYAETWNHELIQSIHKNSFRKDSSSFRGITLLRSLRKLFSLPVYSRSKEKPKDRLSLSQKALRETTEQQMELFSLIKN